MKEPNTKDKGDETEVKILEELVSAGYSVSIPFGDNDKYDLVVDDGSALYRSSARRHGKTNPRRFASTRIRRLPERGRTTKTRITAR